MTKSRKVLLGLAVVVVAMLAGSAFARVSMGSGSVLAPGMDVPPPDPACALEMGIQFDTTRKMCLADPVCTKEATEVFEAEGGLDRVRAKWIANMCAMRRQFGIDR
jgi:hypothetical protein